MLRRLRVTIEGRAYDVTVEDLTSSDNSLYPAPGTMAAGSSPAMAASPTTEPGPSSAPPPASAVAVPPATGAMAPPRRPRPSNLRAVGFGTSAFQAGRS